MMFMEQSQEEKDIYDSRLSIRSAQVLISRSLTIAKYLQVAVQMDPDMWKCVPFRNISIHAA